MKFLIKYSRKTVIKQIYLKKPPKRSFEGGPEEPENPKKRALDNIDRLVSYDIADPDLLGFLKACQKGIKRYPLFMQNSEYFKYTETQQMTLSLFGRFDDSFIIKHLKGIIDSINRDISTHVEFKDMKNSRPDEFWMFCFCRWQAKNMAYKIISD